MSVKSKTFFSAPFPLHVTLCDTILTMLNLWMWNFIFPEINMSCVLWNLIDCVPLYTIAVYIFLLQGLFDSLVQLLWLIQCVRDMLHASSLSILVSAHSTLNKLIGQVNHIQNSPRSQEMVDLVPDGKHLACTSIKCSHSSIEISFWSRLQTSDFIPWSVQGV